MAAHLAAELVAWVVFFPVAIVLLALRVLGEGRGGDTPARVRALLRWYPAAWRERHGDEFGALLEDAIDGGRDGLRLSLDVARSGIVERVRASTASRRVAGVVSTLAWIMLIPQGIVASILSFFGAVPPGWFVALHVEAPARWLVVAGMIAGGTVLLALSLPSLTRTRRRAAD